MLKPHNSNFSKYIFEFPVHRPHDIALYSPRCSLVGVLFLEIIHQKIKYHSGPAPRTKGANISKIPFVAPPLMWSGCGRRIKEGTSFDSRPASCSDCRCRNSRSAAPLEASPHQWRWIQRYLAPHHTHSPQHTWEHQGRTRSTFQMFSKNAPLSHDAPLSARGVLCINT